MIDNKDISKLGIDFATYRSQGTNYLIPADVAPSYSFKILSVVIGDKMIQSESDPSVFYVKKINPDSDFDVLFDHIECRDEDTPDKSITALIYEQGVSVPLCWRQGYLDDGGVLFDFKSITKDLQAGHYFMLVRNLVYNGEDCHFEIMGTNIRLSFHIVPDGESQEHPAIKQVTVSRPAGSKTEEEPLCSGNITVEIEADHFEGGLNDYAVYCFNKNLLLMGKTHTIHPNKESSKKLKLQISSECIWMPDEYFLILTHNWEPFYRYDFTLGDTIKGNAGGGIEKNTPDYVLIKYLEDTNERWETLRNIPGTTLIKRKLMELYSRNILNDLRIQHQLQPIKYNINYLYIRKKRSGEEDVAYHFGEILSEKKKFSYCFLDCAQLTEQRNPTDSSGEESFKNYSRSIVCLSNIGSLLSGNGHIVIRNLERSVHSWNIGALYLAGSESEIGQLFEVYPALARFFPPENRIEEENYGASEAMHYIQMQLKKQDLVLSPKAAHKLGQAIIQADKEGLLSRWDCEYISDFIRQGIIPNYQNRILHLHKKKSGGKEDACDLAALEASDIDLKYINEGESSFEEAMTQLNKMIGLSAIKQSFTTTFNWMKFNERRRQMGFANSGEGCHHMIFTGNPGTGKTTVAKFIGKIYRSLGLLSKGEVIVTERSRMVGQYIGDTERNMQNILAQASGNVLFIDEAYTLYSDTEGGSKKDFGLRAIECLLTVLAQKKPDMLIIFAGYEKEMNTMMRVNPGLKGRFPYTFHFEDYAAGELMSIAENILRKEDYILDPEAKKYLSETIAETVCKKDAHFSNARWMEQYIVNGVIPAMADRVITKDVSPYKNAYRLIMQVDIETAYKQFKIQAVPEMKPRNVVGFRA